MRKIWSFVSRLRRKVKYIRPTSQEKLTPDDNPSPDDNLRPEENLDSDLIEYPPFLNLPVDILVLIFPFLPLLSQASLALSCKSLYGLFGYVLHDESVLAWPRLLASRSYEMPLNQAYIPRNQLLLQLEDHRWLYCSGCLKLHPHAWFSLTSLSTPSLARWCKRQGTVVDLCPCLSLTLSDRPRLERWLGGGLIDGDAPFPSIYREFQLLRTRAQGQQYLFHQCCMVDHADAFVNIVMRVTVEQFNYLTVQTRYHVRMSSPRPVSYHIKRILQSGPEVFSMEPIFLCPHMDILRYLYDRCYWSGNICCACFTDINVIGCSDDGSHVVLQVVRHLGATSSDLPHWEEASRNERYTSRRGIFNMASSNIQDQPLFVARTLLAFIGGVEARPALLLILASLFPKAV